jgi:hypothetical protein
MTKIELANVNQDYHQLQQMDICRANRPNVGVVLIDGSITSYKQTRTILLPALRAGEDRNSIVNHDPHLIRPQTPPVHHLVCFQTAELI